MINILEKIKPKEDEIDLIKGDTEKIILSLKREIKKRKIRAEVFVGGSLAKGTLVKKKMYDIDIFVRFDKKYKEISDVLDSIIKKAGIRAERIHGSRDYFKTGGKILFEIVPVVKIKKPEEAENVTDLSYFHVSYIVNQTKKNKKLADEIILAKYFCYMNDCYGAESYIRGFSGYALELLVSHYRSFMNFIKAVVKSKEKIVLDPGRYYKNRQDILLNLNESKLQSPIVFVDPTFKERNAVAALSPETWLKFREICAKFLKNKSERYFLRREINEKEFNLVIKARTDRQAGDIAGSKLFKFYNFVLLGLEKNFSVLKKDFFYDGEKTGELYFKIKSKKIILRGPPINKVENLSAFRQKHRGVFVKSGVAYARGKPVSVKEFLSELKKDKVLRDMNVKII